MPKQRMPIIRCAWVSDDPVYMAYHDTEWGVPVYDDQHLFEFLILEGAQAGLSWITVLKRREEYRKAFVDYDAKKIVALTPHEVENLMQNKGIIRHRSKIESVITNAKAYLNILETGTTFTNFIWQFVDGTPLKLSPRTITDVPTQTKISDQMSKSLKYHGFKFVGSTICYAFMQAVGLVNDHTLDCFCYQP